MGVGVSHGRVTLGEDVDAQGNGSSFEWKGGKGFFIGEAGTWNSAVLILQMQTPQGTWVPVAAASLTADGADVIDIPAGQIRYSVGTGTPTDLYTWLVHIPT